LNNPIYPTKGFYKAYYFQETSLKMDDLRAQQLGQEGTKEQANVLL